MRVQGWEGLLNEHLERANDLAFAWGENDCALWSSDWVAAATGVDFSAAWRGSYGTEQELAELLAGRGIAGPSDIADAAGLPRVPADFAQRGDIVLHPQGCLTCNGVLSCFLTERGVTRIRTRDCLAAWRVG